MALKDCLPQIEVYLGLLCLSLLAIIRSFDLVNVLRRFIRRYFSGNRHSDE